jgi:hypothetical protein
MDYYLGYYQIHITWIGTVVCFILLFMMAYGIAYIVEKRLKVKDRWWYKILLIVLFLPVPLLCVLIPIELYNYLGDGKLHELYILHKDNKTRLVVWFAREGFVTMGSVYSHRLKSYDFETGKQIGCLDLAIDTGINNYKIFGLFDNNRTWGYRYGYGPELLDLYEPRVLFTLEDILRRNPQLGKIIRIAPSKYDYVFNPRTKGFKVVTAWGEIYEIGTDLKAVPAEDIPNLHEDSVKSDSPWPYREWDFEYPPDEKGKAIKAKDALLSPDRAVLLNPEIVSRLGEEVQSLDKAWVMHWSAQVKNPILSRPIYLPAGDCLLSYVNENGEIIIQYNLHQLLGHEKFRAYSTTCLNGDMYVFVSKAEYTLTALRVDRDTGKILGRIDYL